MRMYLKCALQWVLTIVLFQVVVYYWAVNRKGQPQHQQHQQHQQRLRARHKQLVPHPYLASIRNRKDGTCSYSTCPKIKDGVLNVHLVPHSHIDVGWLKSVDEYYTGEGEGDVGNTQYNGCVRCILNNTLYELMKNPSRTFIFAEMKYFARFWHEASTSEKNKIRHLIKKRQLEIVNGGWVMSDAGITVYNDIIDQHTLGFDFIRETLGPCAQTRTGWHVDQFGHSSEHASIFAQMAYDSLFIGRISDYDKAEMKLGKGLEMIWLTSEKNLGNRSALFTHVTFDGYTAPQGYVLENFDENAFKSSNLLEDFLNVLKDRASAFKTRHLLVPMGSDFGYSRPDLWFKNMDEAIQLVKTSKRTDVNLIYSTPSCYAYYVNQEMKKHNILQERLPHDSRQPGLFATKKDDFLPYITDVVWSGFYTTRGGLKRHIWQAGQILQSCKQLSIFSALPRTFHRVNILRDAMAVMQHHDAITGTQKKAVLENYNSILSHATRRCEQVMANVYQKFWGKKVVTQLGTPHFCHGLNISLCDVSEESDNFLVTVYNPLSWHVDLPLRFPVEPGKYYISNKDQKQIPYQLVPVPDGITDIPERPAATAPTEITFSTNLPPLSVTSFLVKAENKKSFAPEPQFSKEKNRAIVIENQHIALTFSGQTGLLVSMKNKASQIQTSLTQEFVAYIASMTDRDEGAYVFVPSIEPPEPVRDDNPVAIKVIRGAVVQEVHQTFDKSVTQVVRLYNGSKFAEFHWTVGRLYVNPQRSGIDMVSKFTSSLSSKDTFYTDSNGREMIKRRRRNWEGSPNFKISGNYFPVTSRIFIRDKAKKIQLTLLSDRPQGGSSLAPGSLELMVHRRTLNDDSMGMYESLNDRGSDHAGIIYTGKHYLYLDTIENCGLPIRRKAWEINLAPTIMFTEIKQVKNINKAATQLKFLNEERMPKNVHLLTLDRIVQKETTLLLLRLEHALEKDQNNGKNQDAIVDLENLFTPFDVVSVEETTLGGNFNPEEVQRLEWVSEEVTSPKYIGFPDFQANMKPPFRVKLSNMEIRTFRIKIIYKGR